MGKRWSALWRANLGSKRLVSVLVDRSLARRPIVLFGHAITSPFKKTPAV